MINLKNRVVLGVVALVAMILVGCYSVPVTGRKSLDLVDDADVRRLSVEAFEQTKRQYPISRNKVQVDMLNRVGERIAQVVFWDMTSAEWEFVVFDVPGEVNAFAMAGGKVGVFSGLFDLVSNDDQLASVVAHEVAHVTAKHVNEKFSQQSVLAGGGTVLGSAAGGLGLLTQSTILGIYGIGTSVGALGFDRKKEMEADHVGLIYMARAGYDPREARAFMEKMDAAAGGRTAPPKWLSTHPTHPKRILQMIDKMPQALEVYERNQRPVE